MEQNVLVAFNDTRILKRYMEAVEASRRDLVKGPCRAVVDLPSPRYPRIPKKLVRSSNTSVHSPLLFLYLSPVGRNFCCSDLVPVSDVLGLFFDVDRPEDLVLVDQQTLLDTLQQVFGGVTRAAQFLPSDGRTALGDTIRHLQHVDDCCLLPSHRSNSLAPRPYPWPGVSGVQGYLFVLI